ncbi:MAG TPA: response regulator transcription factor [Nevskiaceae bacterium]|nr:response regulator transcription factor [Nevskiaceae bacterium]
MMRIALADDQALVLHGLRALLESLEDLQVVISAENGDALLTALQREAVDVIVSDIRMSHRSGIEVTRALRSRGDMTPVLLLTTFDDPGLLRAAVEAGAQGFMLKDAAPEALRDALVKLKNGETLLAPMSLSSHHGVNGTGPTPRLSPREQAVLRLVAGGYSNKEIGRVLNISDGTVKNHITDILQRLDARDRTHAVLKAIGANLL